MTTAEQLTQVFNDNFVAYFRSHVSHVNITGRNFTSDHELLGGIYESLQSQIDVIGELLRTLDAFMPADLQDIVDGSHIKPMPVEGDAEDLLSSVLDDLEHLKQCYIELDEVAEDEDHEEIANYAQERILAIGKQIWQLRATLG